MPLHTRRRIIEVVLNEILGLYNRPKAEVRSVHKLTGPKKKKKKKKKKNKKKKKKKRGRNEEEQEEKKRKRKRRRGRVRRGRRRRRGRGRRRRRPQNVTTSDRNMQCLGDLRRVPTSTLLHVIQLLVSTSPEILGCRNFHILVRGTNFVACGTGRNFQGTL